MNRGLIEHRVYCLPDHNIRIEDIWDLRAKDCPWVKIFIADNSVLYHHVYYMTQQQYQYHTRNNWSLLS